MKSISQTLPTVVACHTEDVETSVSVRCEAEEISQQQREKEARLAALDELAAEGQKLKLGY
jgi:hypothetical protein